MAGLPMGAAGHWAAMRFRVSLLASLVGLCLSSAVFGKDSLGVYGDWGAFRDPGNTRCYAIAEPDATSGGRPFASVAYWPGKGIRTQFQVRLGAAAQSAVVAIDGQRFRLVTGGNNGWAADKRMDAAIVAALRNATAMRVESRSVSGGLLVDLYRTKGAASAIDAAALGCVRR